MCKKSRHTSPAPENRQALRPVYMKNPGQQDQRVPEATDTRKALPQKLRSFASCAASVTEILRICAS